MFRKKKEQYKGEEKTQMLKIPSKKAEKKRKHRGAVFNLGRKERRAHFINYKNKKY